MASNQKLTKLIAGRAIASSVQAEGLRTVTFAEGSTMKVKTGPAGHAVPPTDTVPTGAPTPGTPTPALTAPPAAPTTTGKKIKKVRQKGCELALDLEDGITWTVALAEATSSVMLRDAAGKLEYAD